ncbi:MAG TPA: UDP-3-O-acyl-N-acetylglucosamine deacetylase [Candidatus Omnitrophota bacterium]|nr:UDP-3-O-acyl-N-acetylglucosamine deacetylase [Candidatus Omnitrophota bacterium]
MKQKTIKNECTLSGVGLHTGSHVRITCKPAAEYAGISFIRIDLDNRPVIKVDPSNICIDTAMPRCTALKKGDAIIYTVEHFMSSLCGLGITNLTVEIDANELPGLDGSAIDFVRALKGAGIVEQNAEAPYFAIKEPVGVEMNGCSIFMVPSDKLAISYTLDYNHPGLKSQFFDAVVDSDTFEREIALCRTFCLESEAEELRSRGLGQGATYGNTLVVGEKGVVKNKVYFANEFARHKALDFIGDLYLLGMPVRGHAYAIKSGHTLNIELLKKILKQKEKYEQKITLAASLLDGRKDLDIDGIMKVLPHRYPFLLVDRVIEIEKGKKAVGIKNVTINESFFRGHFPTRPVMPGVLMIEAMAQVSGIAILTNEIHHGKVAFFMAVDNVKFRKVVSPGDQLIMEVEVLRDKSRTAQTRGQAKVNGEIVAEADMVFSFTDASFLDT